MFNSFPLKQLTFLTKSAAPAIKITGRAGTQIVQTMSNNSAAGAIGHSIVMGNTQTDALTGMNIDLGTSGIAHTGLKIKCYGASTTQYGILIDPSTTSTGSGIKFLASGTNAFNCISAPTIVAGANLIYVADVASSGYGIYFQACSSFALLLNTCSGIGIQLGNITGITGTGIAAYLGDSATAKILDFGTYTTNGAITLARTADPISFLNNRTYKSTSGTITDNYNLQYLKRTSIMNGAGGTFNNLGTVLKLENVSTQTAGTLTDAVDVLYTKQSATITTGRLIVGVVGTTERLICNPGVAASGTAIAYKLDTANTLGTTDKLLSVQNGAAEKAYIDCAGVFYEQATKRGACGGGAAGAGVTPAGTITLEINGTSYFLLYSAGA